MDFFNDLGKRFSNVARSMTEKARESGEMSRISDDLKSATAELNRLFEEFGRACYAIRLGRGDSAVVDALARQIQAQLRRVDALTAQRDDMKDARRCPACGATQPKGARYCSVCGKRLPDEAAADADLTATRYCPGCGALLEKDAAACDICGRRFVHEGDAPAADAPVEAPDAPVSLEEPESFEGEMDQ